MTDDQPQDRESLQAELQKWRARVPKLAAALRERTEELGTARSELSALQSQAGGVGKADDIDARIRARDDMITELEDQVEKLGAQARTASQTLHAEQAKSAALAEQLDAAQEQLRDWKTKRQSLTAQLDDAVASSSKRNVEVDQLRAELSAQRTEAQEELAAERAQADERYQSLKERNQNLLETTELANKQIEALGDELKSLVDERSRLQADKITLGEELAANAAEHEAALATQAAEMQEFKDVLETAEGRLTQAHEYSAQLQAQIDLLQQTDQALQKEITGLKSERDALLTQADEAADAASSRDDECRAAQTRVAELEDFVAVMEGEIEAAQGRAITYVTDLEAAQHSALQGQEKVESLSATIGDMEVALKRHKQDLGTAREEAQTAREKLAELEVAAQQQRDDGHTALRDKDERLAENAAELARYRSLADEQTAKVAELTRELEATRERQQDEEPGEEIVRLAEQLSAVEAQNKELVDAQKAALAVQEEEYREQIKHADDMVDEIVRLNDCIHAAQESTQRSEQERRQLAVQVLELEESNARLTTHLEERSALVRELEEERTQSHHQNLAGHDSQELDELRRNLKEQTHTAQTFKDHAKSLEDKLQSNQQLMSQLEEELSQATQAVNELQKKESVAERQSKERFAQLEEENTRSRAKVRTLEAREEELRAQLATQSDASEPTPENDQADAELRAEVQELRELIRQRTEEADELRWQLEQQRDSGDQNMMMILHQQLKDARAESKRLADKLAAGGPEKVEVHAARLTDIKGVGAKLVDQLRDLGFESVEQIAQLRMQELEDDSHPLHSLRSRIARDEWVSQAQDLLH
ncbi:MAG: hypothetical protein AAF513_03665 [Pseudomonadota bacterium]